MIVLIVIFSIIIFCLVCYIIYLHKHTNIINKCNIIGLEYYKANPDITMIFDDTQAIIHDLQKIGCKYAREALIANKELILSQEYSENCSDIITSLHANINNLDLDHNLSLKIKKLYTDIIKKICVNNKIDKNKLYTIITAITNSLCFF